MKKGFFVLAVVLIIGLYILQKVNTARQLEFTIGVPRNVSGRNSNLTFDLPIQAHNVSQGSIRVKSVDFDVFSAGKFLGKAILTDPFTIAPASKTAFTVGVSISFFDALTAASSIVNLFKSGKITLVLDGLVYAEGFQVPVKQSFEFDIPKL